MPLVSISCLPVSKLYCSTNSLAVDASWLERTITLPLSVEVPWLAVHSVNSGITKGFTGDCPFKIVAKSKMPVIKAKSLFM